MDTAATWEVEDEWELVNDDGFVYKRKRRLDLPSSSSVAPPQAQLPDPTLELRFRRKQKKLRLVKLKERYQREIDQWEHFSNTLSSCIQQTSSAIQLQQQQQKRKDAQETNSSGSSTDELNVSSIVPSSDSTSCCLRNLVDELISQAEAEEGIIENVEYLCQIGGGICSGKERSNKQSLIQLPVWTLLSPRELIKSLSAVDDDHPRYPEPIGSSNPEFGPGLLLTGVRPGQKPFQHGS